MTDSDFDPTVAAQQALAEVIDTWRLRRGVISIEVARRWLDGAPTDGVGIRVVLERLLPREEVPDGELFPRSLGEVPVDLVEGRAPQLESTT